MLANASLIVGVHSDEITESIVDHALALDRYITSLFNRHQHPLTLTLALTLTRRPFLVVPCCVFSNLLPKTRQDGSPVISTEDFIEYLCEKDPVNIRRESLPFRGRNVVLYKLPTPT